MVNIILWIPRGGHPDHLDGLAMLEYLRARSGKVNLGGVSFINTCPWFKNNWIYTVCEDSRTYMKVEECAPRFEILPLNEWVDRDDPYSERSISLNVEIALQGDHKHVCVICSRADAKNLYDPGLFKRFWHDKQNEPDMWGEDRGDFELPCWYVYDRRKDLYVQPVQGEDCLEFIDMSAKKRIDKDIRQQVMF